MGTIYLKNKCKKKKVLYLCRNNDGATNTSTGELGLNFVPGCTLQSHITLLNYKAFRSNLNTSQIVFFQSKLLYLPFYIKVAFPVHVMTNETFVN